MATNVNQQELLQSLLNKISGIVTGVQNDGDKPFITPTQPNVNYLAWCTPGLPFQAADLKFISKGLVGKDAEESRKLSRCASQFAQLANTVPKDNAMNRFQGNNSSLWDIYSTILRQSKVSEMPLPEEDKKKMEKFRNLMTVEEVDLMDDTKKTLKPGPIIKAYNKYMKAYEDACMEYNQKRISSLSGDNSAFLDFQSNGQTYLKRVQAALQEWVTDGYKNEVENMRAFLSQIAEKSTALLKEDLKLRMNPAVFKKTDDAGDFYYTSVLPASFADEDAGWTKFSFKSSEVSTYSKNVNTSSGVKGKANWGLWSVAGGADVKTENNTKNIDSSDFSMRYKITKTPISRPWFSPEFLLSNGWKFEDGHLLSNGDPANAQGDMIAYPVSAIWIKDVTITSQALADHVKSSKVGVDANVSVGYGPFSIAANNKTDTSTNSQNVKTNGNTLEVQGWQIIGFECYKLPKTPNPTAEKDTIWV